MDYLDDRVNTLKYSILRDYPYSPSYVISPLLEFCKSVRESVSLIGLSEKEPFAYYEKMVGNRRLLGFRMPATDSYLIYSCTVNNKGTKPKFLVKVVGIKGSESMPYMKATARNVIQFFKVAEECYREETTGISSINILNLKNGMQYRRDKRVELSSEEMMEDISSKKMN